MEILTTCLFKSGRFVREESYNILWLYLEKAGGGELPVRLFNPSHNKVNKEKLQSLAEALGVDSFQASDDARVANMVLGYLKRGHPINVVWRWKKWMNSEGDDINIIEPLRFEKFEGVIIDKRKKYGNTRV